MLRLRRAWILLLTLTSALVFSGAGKPVVRTQQRGVILVSIKERYLWYVVGKAVVLQAPVAIGVEEHFVYNGKKYDFTTPPGQRRVLAKVRDPVWTIPIWHYYEKAAQRHVTAVELKPGPPVMLGDSTYIQVRDNQVGRVNRLGNFSPFLPGYEIMFDGKLFIPPMGTLQRQAKDVLGPYKLDMGGGYLIHGTNDDNEDSIGQAVSHGCVRMHNDDLEMLYNLVDVGTPVFIR
jgi:lipoprotein-anchoring transpeptidase ErfK/SrfK